MALLTNIPIKDLLVILNKLAIEYNMVDIFIDTEDKKIIINPVDKEVDDSELNDDNIYKLV